MKRLFLVVTLVLAITTFVSCKSEKKSVMKVKSMETSTDSMSYAYGMELERMLREIDSTINMDMVCMGILDAHRGEPRLSEDEKRYAMLKYRYYDEYERVARFEKQFLDELRAYDHDFYATSSGLTYKIRTSGDSKRTAKNSRDTLRIQFRTLDVAERIIDTTYYRNDTLRIAMGEMTKGMQEAIRLIGRGGHIEAWLPSTLAYGSEGCDSLGIEPNTMLYYEIKLSDVEKR